MSIINLNGYSQCGTETVTPVQWCNNDFAQWNITDPQSPNATYYWYNYTGTVPTLNANGFITSETLLDSTTSNVFYSTFRATTTNSPSGVQYTYVRTVNYNAVPFPGTTPAFTQVATSSTFSMIFTSSSAVIMNYVEVPVVLLTPGKQYKIQVTSGTTAGPGSAVYTFSTVGATSLGGNNYLVKIPVNYTFAAGANTLVINTNPTGGTGSNVDGILYSPTQFGGGTYGPVTIGAASAAGNYSVIYNWNFTVVCPPVTTPSSTNTIVGCCTVPASLGLLNLTSNYADIVNGGGTNATLTVGSAVSGDYIAWYLNGVLVPAASGVNKTSYSTNQTGTWSVRDASTAANLSNPSCYVSAQTTIQDQKIFLTTVSTPTHSPLCIGDQWQLSGEGATGLTWSAINGTVSKTNGDTTTFIANTVGSASVTVTGSIISGNEIINGDFSSGATGFATQFIEAGANGPDGTDGTYGVAASAGYWGTDSDWNAEFNYPYATGNPGNFLVLNGFANASATLLAWGQSIAVSPNQTYSFAFDFTPVSYFISTGQSANILTPGGNYENIQLGAYINGTLVGTMTTNFASTGLAAVGKWITYTFSWTAGASITSAALEIRQMTPTTTIARGYDFGLDNISFGGLISQSTTITLGTITDCSTMTTKTVSQTVSSSTINLFPNPAKDILTINLSDMVNGTIIMIDLEGNEVLRQNINGKQVSLSVASVKNGMYVLKVVSNNASYVSKIVVAR